MAKNSAETIGKKNESRATTIVGDDSTATTNLPIIFMPRKKNDHDVIKFDLFRYDSTRWSAEKARRSSRAFIQIELIESVEGLDTQVSSNHGVDRESVADEHEPVVNASLSYSINSKDMDPKGAEEIQIPGGQLYGPAGTETVAISSQEYRSKPESPIRFYVGLAPELAEDLWVAYEQHKVTLFLSLNWLLTGEQAGEVYRHRVTQKMPVSLSMVANRGCFNKYETWADVQHQFRELVVQCFDFFMEPDENLIQIDVITGFDANADLVPHQTVSFVANDASPMKKVMFDHWLIPKNKPFMVRVIRHYKQNIEKKTRWCEHKVRYFDATNTRKF